MVVVPAGSFSMGRDRLDSDFDGRQSPAHSVTFARAFAVGIYDVTRGQYARFIRAANYKVKKGCNVIDPEGRWIMDPDKDWRNPGFQQANEDPVVCVSWNDTQAYISWLNSVVHPDSRNHGPYRLPSEAEWEYVARAGSTTPYYWGPEASHQFANYGINDCNPCGAKRQGRDRWLFTSPVGSFPPNAFGLYDILGNAWQWTQDCMHYSFDGAPADGSPWVTDTNRACYNRILRGGSWLDPDILLTIFIRNPWAPDDRNNANGFRVARTLE